MMWGSDVGYKYEGPPSKEPGYNGAPSNVSAGLNFAGKSNEVPKTTTINKTVPTSAASSNGNSTQVVQKSTSPSAGAYQAQNNKPSNAADPIYGKTVSNGVAQTERDKGRAAVNGTKTTTTTTAKSTSSSTAKNTTVNKASSNSNSNKASGATASKSSSGSASAAGGVVGSSSTKKASSSSKSTTSAKKTSGSNKATTNNKKTNSKSSGTVASSGGSGGGSKIKSVKKAKSTVSALKTKMTTYAGHIDTVNTTLKQFMTGDGKDAYWQGAAAYAWCEKAIGNTGLRKIIENYKISYNEFKAFSKKIEKADLKNRLKGAKKSAVNSMMSQCTGSTYTTGVAADKADKIIAAVLSTVNQDAVNDDQTSASYKSYIALKNSLQALVQDFNTLDKSWEEIKSNTTGKLNSDAQVIINNNKVRRTEVNSLVSMLEEEYIGDIIFS